MTTNHPEKLDEALIRPGRVDHQVPFDYASKHQIRELFIRMYRDDVELGDEVISVSSAENEKTPLVSLSASKSDDGKNAFEGLEITPPPTPVTDHISGDENERGLDDIAKKFSEKIPDGIFSPAEIQGFLLKRKKDPKRALNEIVEWIEGLKGGRGFSVGGGR